MKKAIAAIFILAGTALAQLYPAGGGGGSGTVTSVSGTSTITVSPTTGAVVVSIPSGVALPGAPTATKPASTSNSAQIATTNFVRQLLGALNPAIAVATATVTTLPDSPTYANGTSGVGATLIATTKAALTIDGYSVNLNDRLLINNQASALQNGVYAVSTLGSASAFYVLTRTTDFDTVADINNAGVIPVTNGTVNAGTTWALDAAISAIGTSAISYDQTNPQPPAIVIVNGTPCTVGSASSCNANWINGSVTSGHLATWDGTSGQLQDGGAVPSGSNYNGYGMWQLTVPSFTTANWFNGSGTATLTTGTHFNSVSAPGVNSGNVIYGVATACPSPPFDLYALFLVSTGIGQGPLLGGVDLNDGTHHLIVGQNANGSSSFLYAGTYSSVTASPSTLFDDTSGGFFSLSFMYPVWWHLSANSSSAVTFSYSTDGIGWRTFTQQTVTNMGLTALTNCGLGLQPGNGATNTFSVTLLAFQFGSLTAQ